MIATLRQILPPSVKGVLRPVYRGLCATGRGCARGFWLVLGAVIGHRNALQFFHALAAGLDPVVVEAGIRFDGATARPFDRAVRVLQEEPETIRWLDTYVEPGDVLYDVGANIGIYSLYAAVRRQAVVRAFEPMAANFAILNNNIWLNAVQDRVIAYNIALHDRDLAGVLTVSALIPGRAGHTFNERGTVAASKASFEQGVLGMSMDDFIARTGQPAPKHVKIDVDGNEPIIVAGMRRLLGSDGLRTLVVELDDHKEADRDTIALIESHGFRLLDGEAWVNRMHSSWTNVRNFVFVRD